MVRKFLLIAVGLVPSSGLSLPVEAVPAFRGMSYTAFGENVLSTSASDQSIANMAALGVDTVALNIWEFQDDENATDISLDFSRFSASIPSIQHAIEQIHNRGAKVLLKPNVDLRNGVWRGQINPSAAWFTEYTSFISNWATFAEDHGVELFSVGTEYKNTESWAPQWRNVISNVRQNFSGQVTYSANWDSYQGVAWWDDLDFIGVDAYFPLASNTNPSLSDLQTAWQGHANDIQTWRSGQGLTQRVLFTEVGIRSADGAAQQPWGGSGAGVDVQEQADAYEALLTTMNDKPWWDGAFWWDWTTNPFAGGLSDDGFTPQNKPAQDVLQTHYGGLGIPGPPSGVPSQTFFSWETGSEGWQSTPFATRPTTLAPSLAVGATEGSQSLAVTQTGDGFSWNASVDPSGDQFVALQGALKNGPENYLVELDITYDTASLPGSVNWMNASIAFNNEIGGWSQVDGLALTNGSTDETIHLAIPLTDWVSLSGDSAWYQIHIAINGQWGASGVTVYYDNLSLTNLLVADSADFNLDGNVDGNDLSRWESWYGMTAGAMGTDGDADADGDVDGRDFLAWQRAYNSLPTINSLGHTVPEPACMASQSIAVILGMMMCQRGRSFAIPPGISMPYTFKPNFSWIKALVAHKDWRASDELVSNP